jgi:hypothetical protein
MGTRISLGKGWTVGRSGPRWGTNIPGVPKSYVSVGASGTLVTGYHVRHWQGAGRTGGRKATQGSSVPGLPRGWEDVDVPISPTGIVLPLPPENPLYPYPMAHQAAWQSAARKLWPHRLRNGFALLAGVETALLVLMALVGPSAETSSAALFGLMVFFGTWLLFPFAWWAGMFVQNGRRLVGWAAGTLQVTRGDQSLLVGRDI